MLGSELHLDFDVLLLTGNSSWSGNLCLSLKDKRCVTVILLLIWVVTQCILRRSFGLSREERVTSPKNVSFLGRRLGARHAFIPLRSWGRNA